MLNTEELKKSLLEKFVGKQINEQTLTEITDEVKKAVKAGYETSPESHGNPVEEIEANAPVMDSNKVETKEVETSETSETAEPVEESDSVEAAKTEDQVESEKDESTEDNKEEQQDTEIETKEDDKEVANQGGETEQLQFEDGLFQDFSLGATLRQRPHGNVMTNMKNPDFDYEEAYKNSIKNIKVSKEEAEKEDKK